LIPLQFVRVLTAIQFNRETQGRTIEIQNERASRMLASKIDTKLPVAQLLPQHHFNVGRIAAKAASCCGFEG